MGDVITVTVTGDLPVSELTALEESVVEQVEANPEAVAELIEESVENETDEVESWQKQTTLTLQALQIQMSELALITSAANTQHLNPTISAEPVLQTPEGLEAMIAKRVEIAMEDYKTLYPVSTQEPQNPALEPILMPEPSEPAPQDKPEPEPAKRRSRWV